MPQHIANVLPEQGALAIVMAILNVTEDSFSGDGLYGTGARELAEFALNAVAEGARIIDVGGAAGSPIARPVDSAEEVARISETVTSLVAQPALSGVALSVDTLRPSVADAAIAIGASVINSTWGIRLPTGDVNEELLATVDRSSAWLVLTHNRPSKVVETEYGRYFPSHQGYESVVDEVVADLEEQLTCVSLRFPSLLERTIVDPGLGLGKSPDETLAVLREIGRISSLGRPVLLGHSRKSVLGAINGSHVNERDLSTAVMSAMLADCVQILRVHNVKANADALRVAEALKSGRVPGGQTSH